MQIILTKSDVEKALRTHVESMVSIQPETTMRIDLASNGEASITLGDAPVQQHRGRGRPPKSATAHVEPPKQPTVQPTAPVATKVEAATPPAAAPGKTLFGNLQRPSNAPPPEPAAAAHQ